MDRSALTASIGRLQEFVDRFEGQRLFSTSANVVTYTASLYNVIGSTSDPKIPGYPSWNYLLQQFGIGVGSNDHCYVDPQTPDHSHPAFQVGGHMTPNQDGTVPTTGICYLMPLCKWHNGKGNNHVAFAHSLTQILELHGYMTSEPAATFMARRSGQAPAALVFAADEGLLFQTLSPEEMERVERKSVAEAPGASAPDNHIVLRRQGTGAESFYTIERVQLA